MARVVFQIAHAGQKSGVEESFRSLLGLLDREFDPGLGAQERPHDREALVPYIIQRRRADMYAAAKQALRNSRNGGN